jgi:hypothetical protein
MWSSCYVSNLNHLASTFDRRIRQSEKWYRPNHVFPEQRWRNTSSSKLGSSRRFDNSTGSCLRNNKAKKVSWRCKNLSFVKKRFYYVEVSFTCSVSLSSVESDAENIVSEVDGWTTNDVYPKAAPKSNHLCSVPRVSSNGSTNSSVSTHSLNEADVFVSTRYLLNVVDTECWMTNLCICCRMISSMYGWSARKIYVCCKPSRLCINPFQRRQSQLRPCKTVRSGRPVATNARRSRTRVSARKFALCLRKCLFMANLRRSVQ